MALTPPASEAEFTGELMGYLYEAYAVLPEGKRDRARWVMSAEWFGECLKIDAWQPFQPRPVSPSVTTIFGLPIEIRDDGGAPHLEA